MTARYTARGGPGIEALIGNILEDAAMALSGALRPSQYRSVVLIGGYGRGEGGVVLVDGAERPHNNLDFLVIARQSQAAAAVRQAHEALRPLRAHYGIGMDVGAVTEAQLGRAPCLVMWHDMRYGHKVLLGDPTYVASLTQFRPEVIVPWDVRNLLVNRGTLLLLNELILAKPAVTEADRRTVVRHAMKAIIGYGDALLFFLGGYHWSYLEKQRRMREHPGIHPSLRRLYDRAAEFRFQPDYASYAGCDLARANQALREGLAPVHLECEQRRLGLPGLCWEAYAESVSRATVSATLRSPRALARRLRTLGQTTPGLRLATPLGKLGHQLASPGDRLSVLFPGIAYPRQAPGLAARAAEALRVSPERPEAALARAYMAKWGRHGDTNLPTALDAMGLSLSEAA